VAVIPSRQYLVWLLAESGGCLAGIKTTNMAAKAVVAEARAAAEAWWRSGKAVAAVAQEVAEAVEATMVRRLQRRGHWWRPD